MTDTNDKSLINANKTEPQIPPYLLTLLIAVALWVSLYSAAIHADYALDFLSPVNQALSGEIDLGARMPPVDFFKLYEAASNAVACLCYSILFLLLFLCDWLFHRKISILLSRFKLEHKMVIFGFIYLFVSGLWPYAGTYAQAHVENQIEVYEVKFASLVIPTEENSLPVSEVCSTNKYQKIKICFDLSKGQDGYLLAKTYQGDENLRPIYFSSHELEGTTYLRTENGPLIFPIYTNGMFMLKNSIGQNMLTEPLIVES